MNNKEEKSDSRNKSLDFEKLAISSRFIILEGCPKYLTQGVRWMKTAALCKRDGEPIWREQNSKGELLNIFGCSRSGCTWTNYYSNKEDIIKQLNEN